MGQWNKKTARILTDLGGFWMERAMGIEQRKFYGDMQIMERIKRK